MKTLIQKLNYCFFAEQENWILWIPVIFALGIIFYSYFDHLSFLLPAFLFLYSLILIKKFSENLIFIAIAIFLFGFLWAGFYNQKIISNQKIDHILYARVIGKVNNISSFNSNSKQNYQRITLTNIEIYKIKNLKSKKTRRRKTKSNIKNYLNLKNHQEIDREFLTPNYKLQNQKWLDGKYKNPPKKLIIIVRRKLGKAEIGDLITSKIFIKPYKPYFPSKNKIFRNLTTKAYATSDFRVIKKSTPNKFTQKINKLRQNLKNKILSYDNSGIAAALIVGIRDHINNDLMQSIRNSGLAHLIAISGLHFTLVVGSFFFITRFFLSFNENLTLNFNIKKIAAFLAIFIGFFYLIISGMPISAIRACIIITLILIAVIFDLKPNIFRLTAFAALLILLFNPNAIFLIGFQLSFAAILSLINLTNLFKKSSSKSPILKLFYYFLSIICCSLATTSTTTPIIIYHFNHFVSFGILANLLAIPLISFITMPLGFLSLILIPFEINNIFLQLMQISISALTQIIEFTSSLPNSNILVKQISLGSFIWIILGGLWFLIWQQKWRFLGIIGIIIGFYLAYQTPKPDFIIDKERRKIAFYYNDKLIFLKPTKSKQAIFWAKKLGLKQFYDVNNLSQEEKNDLKLKCQKTHCYFILKNQRILVLTGRNKINDICPRNYEKKYDLVININNKYKTPKCVKNGEIDHKILNLSRSL